ncbi:alpha/beta hydrolase [Curtobacterium sp. Curtsp57]|uniref:alpha/beta hydrolase n=1 Tax=Curtobacterium sp. Curtsp57 TaxID=3243047 RepID=UPI0039B43971
MIGNELGADSGARFVRETALAAGRIDIAAAAGESAFMLAFAADIADTMVTTARRNPNEPRVRMADAVQELWEGVLDVEAPRLIPAIGAAAVTIGAALWPAQFAAATGSPSLYSRLVDVRTSIEESGNNRDRSIISEALSVGEDLARSFGWHSDAELARSRKFRAAIASPYIASALSAVPLSRDGLEVVEAAVAALVDTTYEHAAERFGNHLIAHARAEIPVVDIDFPDELMHSADGSPGEIELVDLSTDDAETDLEALAPPSGPTDQRVTVYFGTDRAAVTGDAYFANRRDVNDAMHYGIAVVDVPESHSIGGRRRLKIGWRTISWAGSTRLTSVIRLSRDEFLGEVDREVHAAPDDEKRVLVFVHGFRTSFRRAMLTAGQLTADLGINAVTAAFSWPSANRALQYKTDRRAARSSAVHLVDFIVDLTQRTGAQSVDLVFHSMGNYLFAQAAASLAGALAAAGQRLGAVILAAPDVTPNEFRVLAGLRPALSAHGTMYATRRDRALGISGAMRGTPRAGALPPVIAHHGIDTIDATLVNESFIGHAYYTGSRAVMADIFHAVRGDPPGTRFGLTAQPNPTHWRIKR